MLQSAPYSSAMVLETRNVMFYEQGLPLELFHMVYLAEFALLPNVAVEL